jgi:hypothetical protein
MNIRRLLYTSFGKNLISIILGLGLASLFRKVCKERNCLIFKGPDISNIQKQIYQYGDKCYSFKENATSCSKNKKTVEFQKETPE